ncbi:MAG TPA: metal-dependent hydrolase [Acidimicrobiales bacterium]|nr:metal-dependent hydrolase [Acidimicrobiales bacterium]
MTSQTSNPDLHIPTRRISFEEAIKTVPKHFAKDGDIVSSHVAAGLSAVFPDGEDFFVASVRHFRPQITDPDLKRQVSGFIGQESVHGREHRVLNDRFAELGYPTKQIEKFTKAGLRLRFKYTPKKASLAMTAALEHFTATLAELILSDPEARGMFGDETVKNLFLWHALEEAEHKAVAFDVYKAAGGSERLRVFTMNMMRYGFPLGMALQVLVSLLLDPEARCRPRRVLKSVRRLRKSPLLSRALWLQLKDYNRPDFHPSQSGHTGLVDQWREELFGANGTLNDKLNRTAA